MGSLFNACKNVARYKEGGTYNIGGYEIELEYYNQQSIDDDVAYGDVAFGDSDESKILIVADNTITIPEGYTLTPDSPKKSLVIFCNNLINNGTISMYQKAPNVLPHNYYIIEGKYINSNRDVTIPAYADNAVPSQSINAGQYVNGNNGTNRQCGSGGTGGSKNGKNTLGATGSGYAFGGGAGSGGIYKAYAGATGDNVNSTYPMRGGNGFSDAVGYYDGQGGCGNPSGSNTGNNPVSFSGCGGRVIIFCCNFENNGNINVNGTTAATNMPTIWSGGGGSGAGAVDIFYTTLATQGTITANGGNGVKYSDTTSGKGGNGSITLTPWTIDKLYKGQIKYFSQSNVNYLLSELALRIKETHINE